MEVLLIGSTVGLMSGLFGIGGSLIATPLLRLTGADPLIALATPLPAVIPTALAGSLAYWRRGLIHGRAALWLLAGGLPGTLVGAYATRLVSGQVLMLLTGLLLLAVGARFLWESSRSSASETDSPSTPQPAAAVLIGIGIVSGLVSGFLAIGGGIVLVPALALGLRFPFKKALATSLLCVAGLAIPGSLAHTLLGHVDFSLLLPFVLGSIPLAYVGGRLAIVVPVRQLRRLYGVTVAAFALYFLWTQWRG